MLLSSLQGMTPMNMHARLRADLPEVSMQLAQVMLQVYVAMCSFPLLYY